MQVSEGKTEVLDINDSVREISKGFDLEVSGSLRPKGYKNPDNTKLSQ